jgi:hypothetical protein
VCQTQPRPRLSPSSLTFTSGNWNLGQHVTITGVDDADLDGDQSVTITLSGDPAQSDDAFDSLGDITVGATNEDDEVADTTAPTITSSNTASVPENTTAVLTLAADESVTWSITGGADMSRFTLSGDELVFSGAPDFEAPSDADSNNVYLLEVKAEDAAGNTSSQSISVTVTDVSESPPADTSAPMITGSTQFSVESGVSMEPTYYSANEPVTWSLSAMDAALFSISVDGRLAMNDAPNAEQPNDHNRDNRYMISVVATDGAGNQSALSVLVDVERGNAISTMPMGEVAQSSI